MLDLVPWPAIEPGTPCIGSLESQPLDHQGSSYEPDLKQVQVEYPTDPKESWLNSPSLGALAFQEKQNHHQHIIDPMQYSRSWLPAVSASGCLPLPGSFSPHSCFPRSTLRFLSLVKYTDYLNVSDIRGHLIQSLYFTDEEITVREIKWPPAEGLDIELWSSH